MAPRASNVANRGALYHANFAEHWKRCSLYSMAEWVNGLAFRDINFSATGLPVIKIAEIKGGISRQTKFTQQTFMDAVRVRRGDLLFSWSGQPETSIDAFWWRGPEGWLNQHVFRVSPANGIDPTFFFYLLRYLKPNFVGIARNKQTTGLGHVTRSDLENIEAAYPKPAEQRAIAHILRTLDDKIDLNRRMNQKLEEIAHSLFTSWFIDFDPVRAKVNGRQPEGLDSEMAALFPASVVDSEIGDIPAGWQIRGLDEIATYLNGLPLQRYAAAGDRSMPAIKIAQLRKGNTEGADQVGVHVPSEYIVDDGDVVFSWSGSLEVKIWCGGRGALNQHLFKVTSSTVPNWFFYKWIQYHLAEFREIAAGKATTMGHIQRHHLSDAKVILPPHRLLCMANNTIGPLFSRYISNSIESRTLINLVSLLLPRLISGEISTKNFVI